MMDILRHTVLTSLLTYKNKYGKEYGEMVIACDSKGNWRKTAFPHYKATRKKGRDESPVDWDATFECITNLKVELRDVFPWTIIDVPKCEGDDVIGVLTKYVREHRTRQDGFYELPEPVMIISSDGDMKQLHGLGGVRQWSPIQKKLVPHPEPDFLVEKIIRGDGGDNVPSVLCADDWFVNPIYDGVRAKPVTKAVIAKYKDLKSLTEEEHARYQRNRTLVDFSCIPIEHQDQILAAYLESKPVKDLNKIMEFLMRVKAKQLLARLNEFKL